MERKTAEHWIKELGLIAHPEGGHYKEVYRSAIVIPPNGLPHQFAAKRNIHTSIYYLLSSGEKSHFHRLRSDELWYFHAGEPLTIMVLSDQGLSRLTLGLDLSKGEQPHHVIPAESWFGAFISGEDHYCLCSCAVAPGFDFHDFELAERNFLLKEFPQYEKEIHFLTRP